MRLTIEVGGAPLTVETSSSSLLLVWNVVFLLIVGWARSTASVVVLQVMFSCWWQSGATSIVGDRRIPALMGLTGWSFSGDWGP